MRITINNSWHPARWVLTLFCLAVCLALVATPLQQLRTRAQSQSKEQAETPGEVGFVPAAGKTSGLSRVGRNAPIANRPSLVGTDQGSESEPNNTFGTADVLPADVLTGITEGKIKGNNFSGISTPPGPAGTDEDWYSFTTTVASSKVYAAVIDSSASQQDSVLEVVNIGGAPVLELDDQDGTFGGSSSSIAGTVLAAPGTYYLRVTNFSTTAPIAPYDLYFAVRDPVTTPLTAETEPNNNGTPQVLPASQYVSGVIDPLADSDTFTFTATAGDTVFLSLDLDPERDVTTFNGRVGLGLFGTPAQLLVTGDAGTFDTIDSEAFVMTVDSTGTYTVYVDSQVATAGATQTYNLNVTTIPAAAAGTCTTYTNAVSTAIPDLALTTSTIVIPATIIRSLRATVDITHANFPDLDVHLRSPATSNNDNGLFTDVGVSTQTGAQNLNLMDEAALPILFTNNNGMIYKPEGLYRLDWFKGENSLGTWSLDIRDDTTANTGTLNSWSLEVCEEPAPTGTLVYSQNFETYNGGYTLGPGLTANEWEYGTPATVGTTTANPVAPFLNCASGTNCWKTDLDNTYEISSSQDLTSPNIGPLPAGPGVTTLSWQARYQMESVSFDRIWVRVTEVGVPANTRLVWHANNQTMVDTVGSPAVNIPASAGWGGYSADISDFKGMSIQVTFHLESDSSINFAGFAIDDVQIRTTNPTAADGTVSGRITDPNGVPIAGAVVNLSGTQSRKFITDANGNYRFNNVETSGFYTVTPARANYQFSPSQRSFSLVGSNTDATFSGSFTGDHANPLDTAEYFVRQQYLDVLSREPDEGGFNYWSDQLNACGGDAECTRSRRTGVAAAFFIEQEAQETGSFIYNLYEGALGRRPAFGEYATDRRQVVGGANLEAMKAAFAQSFVQRAEFAARYQGNASGESFVDALLANLRQSSGVDLSSERGSLISRYNTGANQTESRSFVLRDVTENEGVRDANYNESFVLTEYFSYLGRNPDAGGYDFWLGVLNDGDRGNYRGMVCSFITSTEYQRRFSALVTHSNAECGQ